MIYDSVPDNASMPSTYPVAGPGAFDAGGIDPGDGQLESANASLRVGIFNGAVTQGRPVGSDADVVSPQRFPLRQTLEQMLSSTAVGDDEAAESLPGRIYPTDFWDGEPGWAAPGGQYP